MSENPKIKADYSLSKCCSPEKGDNIVGYYSYNNIIKIHKADCPYALKVERERLLKLDWKDILESDSEYTPDKDYHELDDLDFKILHHHHIFGIDYSLVIARKLNITKEEAFERHNKLKNMMLVERVNATMVQYRKGIVDNKWIKHRNHTYYQLTSKGYAYLQFYHKSC